MFAEEEDETDENVRVQDLTKDSGISNTSESNSPAAQTFLSPAAPSKSVKSQNPVISPSISSSKATSQSSISSTLKSTLNQTSNNFGLVSRVRQALRSNGLNTTRMELSGSASPSGTTPAVYTLLNAGAQVEPNAFAGPHYGLSDLVWAEVKQAKGITALYDWQDQCLNKAVETSNNLLYSLPTSGGKTLVAEILMVRELLCNRKHCLYVLPYVSIVQEKIRTLSSLALSLDFAVEEYAGNRGAYPPRQRKKKKVIYIATLEKAHGIINSLMELGRLQEIGIRMALKNLMKSF